MYTAPKFLLFLIFSLYAVGVRAARIEVTETKSDLWPRGVIVEGEIRRGDFAKFASIIINAKGVNRVYLASPGGDFLESLKIGRLVRLLNLEIMAPLTRSMPITYLQDPKNNVCASSCFFIYLGGARRFGQVLGIHRPYLPKDSYRSMGLKEAENSHVNAEHIVHKYLVEMGAPASYGSRILAIDSGDIEWLDSSEINRDFGGFVAKYREWFSANCPRPSDDDELEMMRIMGPYWSVLDSTKGIGGLPLSSKDKVFVNDVLEKRNSAGICEDRLLSNETEKERAKLMAEVVRKRKVISSKP